VLLTRPEALPDNVADEITRLDPDSIVLLGDTNAVAATVETALDAIAPTTRIAGANRYATARALVASEFGAGSADAVYLASGLNFPDALSAGGAAAAGDDPVILVNGSLGTLDAATLGLLQDISPTDIHVLGAANAVSSGIQTQLTGLGYTVTRYAGANRYETSRLVNEAAFDEAEYAVFTTGTNYPDALAGTPFAAVYGAPVYLVKPDCVPQATLGELDRLNTAWVAVLGGPPTVSDNALNLGACSS
jgi:putative cell wall-binding protein